MPKTEKVKKVTELSERIRGSEALFITDFRGLTVADVTELRRSLRENGTRLTVAKNTLLKLAAGEAGVEGLDDLLQGPTAVAFVDSDPIAAAKGLVDAIKRFRTLEIRGGYMEGKVMSSAEAEALATIEPREVLLAKLAGAMKAEMSRAAYMFQSLQSKFLSVLEAYKEKVPGEPEPEAAPADEAAPPAETEAPAEATGEAEAGTAVEVAEEAEAPAEAEAASTDTAEAVEEPEAGTDAGSAGEPEAEATEEPEASSEADATEEPEASTEADAGTEAATTDEAEASSEAEAGDEAKPADTGESETTSETDEAPAADSDDADAEGKE